jgi:hypothetical protein
MRKYGLLALLVLLPPFLSAARLTLRDGAVIYGQFISGTPQTVVFQDDNGVRRRFDLKQVQNIDFRNFSPQAAAHGPLPGGLQYGDTEADREDPGYSNDWAVIPAGGSISVRIESTITQQNASDGRTWPAVIVEDVLADGGKVAIPRGTPAVLAVRRIAEGSTLTSASYILGLDSVRLGGRRYAVSTGDVPAGYEGALGTLMAASAGRGPVQVLTAGPEIRVPADTVLSFRLQAPLHLREVR